MRFQLMKSNLSEHNKGRSGSASNCYYTGSTVCWVVIDTIELYDNEPMEIIAVNKKFVAIKIVDWANKVNYNGIGDPAGMFLDYCRDNKMWKEFDAFKEV